MSPIDGSHPVTQLLRKNVYRRCGTFHHICEAVSGFPRYLFVVEHRGNLDPGATAASTGEVQA
jgi:hypothetical protein